MTDRELLELAAKATGKDIDPDRYDDDWGFAICHMAKWWNPLTDDGDALRLAVKLRMEIDHNHPADQQPWVSVRAAPSRMLSVEEFEGESGRMTATRRAIVRAAAEIGKAMP